MQGATMCAACSTSRANADAWVIARYPDIHAADLWTRRPIHPLAREDDAPTMAVLDVLIASALIVALIALGFAKRRHVPSHTLALFRVLLPSWRFFEEIAPAPHLLCRFGSDHGDLGPWQVLLQSRSRTPLNLMLNARGNLRLACHSVLEHLQDDLETLPADRDPTDLVAYQLVRNIVLDELAARPEARDAPRFQFCIADTMPSAAGRIDAPLLLSEIHDRGA
jgi:hypothetical protein